MTARPPSDITPPAPSLRPEERARLLGHRGGTVWLTGLSGSGKSTIAAELEARLVRSGRPAYRVDGDSLRTGLNAGLGFAAADRAENVRRAGEACLLLADAGVLAIASLISPYRRDRDLVRRRHQACGLPFLEVHVDVPLAEAERRDPKGLYAKARRGELPGFTGVDDPYEPPLQPELRIPTGEWDLARCVEEVLRLLGRGD